MFNFGYNMSDHIIPEAELRKVCPHAYAEAPTNPEVSDKYVLANTATVINDMRRLGWMPVRAAQRVPRKKSGGKYSFHMVAFQNADCMIFHTEIDKDGNKKIVDAYPQIILTNSHDGQNCFKFMVGLFRLVCSNGLVVASEKFANIRIRHINYSFEELTRTINELVESLPEYVETIDQMKNRILTAEEKKALATDIIRIKKNDENYQASVDSIEALLNPTRREDQSDDLFTVFNVLQEKIIRGGVVIQKEGDNRKGRALRAVKSFVSDISLNQRMFQAATQYLEAV